MADDRTFKYEKDQQNLSGDAIIHLYTLDIYPADNDVPAGSRYFRFVNWVEADGVSVQYDGELYTPIPLEAQGFLIKTEGVPPNPTIRVGNIGLEFTGLVNTWNDLVGAELKIRRILAKHLDNGSDPNTAEHWPDETWTVQQKAEETKLYVSFQLATAFDLDGCMLPKRRALRYTCPWIYRSSDCSYTGPPIADIDNNKLTSDSDATIQDLYDKRVAWETAIVATETALTAYSTAQAKTGEEQEKYDTSYVSGPEQYSRTAPTYFVSVSSKPVWNQSGESAMWNGSPVTLGATTYVRGSFRESGLTGNYYGIRQQVQGSDADLLAAQADEAAKKTTYDAAVADEAAKKEAYDDAVAAWQTSSPQPQDPQDVCAKNFSACKLRFGTGELPFGGFPGLTLDL